MPAPRQTIRVLARQLTDEQLHRLGATRGDRIERRYAPNGAVEFLVNGRLVRGVEGEYDARTDGYNVAFVGQEVNAAWLFPTDARENRNTLDRFRVTPAPLYLEIPAGRNEAGDAAQRVRRDWEAAELRAQQENRARAEHSLREGTATLDWLNPPPRMRVGILPRIEAELARLREFNLVPMVIAVSPTMLEQLRPHLADYRAVRPMTSRPVPWTAVGDEPVSGDTISVDEQFTLQGIRVVEDIYTYDFVIAVKPLEN